MSEYVILVDEQDQQIGVMEKIEAHEKALLHRAFSVFIFNTHGALLLQQRAAGKYHSPLLWTNACCSHPKPGESIADAAARRLREELGMTCPLQHGFHFVYKTPFDNGLTEHELDHVLIGITDDVAQPNPEEVEGVRYISWDDLQTEMEKNPEAFTSWFKICWQRVKEFVNTELNGAFIR